MAERGHISLSLGGDNVEIQVISGAIQEQETDLIVVNLFEGLKKPGGATGAVDRALGGQITEIITAGDFKGKLSETLLLYPRGDFPAKRVLVMGLGKEEDFDLDVIRKVAATAAKTARKLGVADYCSIVHGGGRANLTLKSASQAVVEGTILGLYRFTKHKTERKDEDLTEIDRLTLVEFNPEKVPEVREGVIAGQIIAESTCFARDLVNQPANHATPTILAETARQMAEQYGLACQILGENEMKELGMGALLSVARGSDEPAKFIILEHNADRTDLDTIVFVGKGITFDSGGISLKPSKDMGTMKADMAGAAAVLGALRAAALLDLPLHVVGLAPCTENLPSGHASKPADVVKSMSGLTIEIVSTDAEGRMILADALTYAKRYAPKAVVDLATLTGACVVALGTQTIGLMSNDPTLAERLEVASYETAEKVWELPLFEEYGEQIKSDVADLKNSGGRPAGAITAGFFLSHFTEDYPWAHLDIAGKALVDKDQSYIPKGATGVGVRLLVQMLRDWGNS